MFLISFSFKDTINQYKTILRSNIGFDEVKLHFWDYKDFTVQRLKEIFINFQSSIRKVTIGFSAISYSCLISLLALLPNINEIVIDISLIGAPVEPKQRLSCLTSLKSFTSRVETSQIIFELPNNILSKLIFKSSVCEAAPPTQLLESIFEKQCKVTELNLNPEKVHSVEILKLKTLWLANNCNVRSLLRSQESLTSLSIFGHLNRDEIVKVCCSEKLRTLHVAVNGSKQNSLFIENLQKLKKLEVLTYSMTNCHIKLDAVFLGFLVKFELNLSNCSCDIEDLIHNLPVSCPCLKHFKLKSLNTIVDVQLFASLLRNKNMTKLELFAASNLNDLQALSIGIQEKLSEVYLGPNIEHFEKFLKFCPNLEKLSICVKDLGCLKDILMIKKLTHLSLTSQSTINVCSNDFFRTLCEFGKKLNYFDCQCSSVDKSFLSKFRSTFGAQFSKIEFISKDNLNLLVMRNNKWN